jgi:hypothetical protein
MHNSSYDSYDPCPVLTAMSACHNAGAGHYCHLCKAGAKFTCGYASTKRVFIWCASSGSKCIFTLHNLFVTQATSDPERFVLHPQPLEYKYSEFERLLLGIAHHIYITKKKGEAFEEVGGWVAGKQRTGMHHMLLHMFTVVAVV